MVIANNVRLAGTRGARNDETTGDTSVTTVSSINVRIAGTHGARNKAPGGRFFGRVDDGRLDALATAMREVGAVHGGKTPAQVTLAWRTGQLLTGHPRALDASRCRPLPGTGCHTWMQVALNWLICQGAVPIPGAKNARQATDNAGALGWRMSAEEVARLGRLGLEGGTNIWQHDGRV